MQANFFATTEDWLTLWDWVVGLPGMRVIEHYSRPDLPNREFNTPDEVQQAFQNKESLIVAWPSSVGGKPRAERVNFEPNTVRKYGAEGRWIFRSPALITFMQHNEQRAGCLSPGSFSCWSEAGARQRSIYPEEFLDEVDWKAFASITRGLQRKMRSASGLTFGAAPILPDAKKQLEAGKIKLWGWGEEVTISSPHIKSRR
jgi:hypothetical protein